MRIFDFLNILALLAIFTGVVTFIDWFLRGRGSKDPQVHKKKQNWFVEYSRAFFPVFLIVLIIRSFLFQPYRVPTGSLEPTVIPGDLILVTQYNYGLKIPLWDKVLIKTSEPKRGQIALFNWPVNPKMTFVKRVVGMPGDHISYNNKVFTINGVVQKQTYVGPFQEIRDGGGTTPTKRYLEDLAGVKHYIIRNPAVPATNFKDLIVPKGMYMMIGDNRDDSDDSRDWGFVRQDQFIGRAMFVWFNIDFSPFKIRWDRIGTKLYGSVDTAKK